MRQRRVPPLADIMTCGAARNVSAAVITHRQPALRGEGPQVPNCGRRQLQQLVWRQLRLQNKGWSRCSVAATSQSSMPRLQARHLLLLLAGTTRGGAMGQHRESRHRAPRWSPAHRLQRRTGRRAGTCGSGSSSACQGQEEGQGCQAPGCSKGEPEWWRGASPALATSLQEHPQIIRMGRIPQGKAAGGLSRGCKAEA